MKNLETLRVIEFPKPKKKKRTINPFATKPRKKKSNKKIKKTQKRKAKKNIIKIEINLYKLFEN